MYTCALFLTMLKIRKVKSQYPKYILSYDYFVQLNFDNLDYNYFSFFINITRKNAEYLDYQIPVTQLKGPKGNGDVQAAKRD